MTTLTCVAPTATGDGTTPIDLSLGPTVATLRIAFAEVHGNGAVPTTAGDDTHLFEFWSGTTYAAIRLTPNFTHAVFNPYQLVVGSSQTVGFPIG